MFNTVEFNGRTNEDIGVEISSVIIQPPSKKKILDSVLGMNGTYDFSTVASNGDQPYNTREISIKFNMKGKTKEELYMLYTSVLAWLVDAGQSQLTFNFIDGYYFMAEVENAPKFETMLRLGTLDVIFIAEPFKISTSYMGDDIWDTFCFLTDYTQYTNTFSINGDTIITMCNNGRLIVPTINVDSAMRLTFNNIIYNLAAGDNKLWGLKLQNGRNDLAFNGNGTAKILFRWEAL